MIDLMEACRIGKEKALQFGASEVEVYGRSIKEVESFLERNDIKLGKSHSHAILGIRVFKEMAMGFASLNELTVDHIEKAVRDALKIAGMTPRDENNILPRKSSSIIHDGLYDQAAEGFGASDSLEVALEMLETTKSYDPRVTVDSGAFNSSIFDNVICTSSGIERSETISLFSWAIMGMATEGAEVSSFDYQVGSTHEVRGIHATAAARVFAENVVNSLGAKKIQSFTGGVILSPQALMELVLQTVVSSLRSDNVQKGRSKFKDRLGESVASESLTIRDDGTNPNGPGASSFDREGVSTSPIVLVDNGELKSLMFNTYTASKDGAESTGHATGSPRSSPSVGPSNIMIDPGEVSKEELISELEKGVLVTRFSGNTSAVSGDFSGVVKGGFLIERGEILHPIKETLVAGNVFDLLRNISAISKEREWMESALLPYIHVEGISIIGG
ncbi:MAG: TldD/PmbA family protein [Thaumarchaeota archaeon]|nr:TldD/PmbA family protein [Nitrososphaerota archaeon]